MKNVLTCAGCDSVCMVAAILFVTHLINADYGLHFVQMPVYMFAGESLSAHVLMQNRVPPIESAREVPVCRFVFLHQQLLRI